jgi:microcystin-dependent protein
MPLDYIDPYMTTGLLKTSNRLSELTGNLATAYTNIRLDQSLPVGIILPFTGSTTPSGWLLCYGQAISRSTYAALFAVLGTQYGSGNGSTTFNVPDLRGRVVAGRDNMGGTAASNLTETFFGSSPNSLGNTGGTDSVPVTAVDIAEGFDNQAADSSSNSNVQPTMVLNYIIKSDLVTEAVP